jgi:hypothetical protein
MKTKDIFDDILESNLFRLNGPEIDLPEKVQELCAAIEAEDEADWFMNEGGECTLDQFIIGAFWSFTQWHGGHYSPEYATLCALGDIFSPGMTNRPEDDTGEQYAFDACNQWFEARGAD